MGTVGEPDQFSASPAGVDFHLGKSREQIHLSARRALLARNFERSFHLVQRLLWVGGGQGAHHSVAVIAFNVALLPANDAIQEACTFRVAEITMRDARRGDTLITRAVADRAIARPGERLELSGAVWTARILSVTKRHTPTGLKSWRPRWFWVGCFRSIVRL